MNSEQYRTSRIRVFNWPTSVLGLFIVYCERRGGEGWPMDLSQRHSFEIGIRLFFLFPVLKPDKREKLRHHRVPTLHTLARKYRPIRDFLRTSLKR